MPDPSPTQPVRASAFPIATIYWCTRKRSTKPRLAHLSISTAIRWIHTDEFASNQPLSFRSFRGHHCLTLTRLDADKLWNDAITAVQAYDDPLGPAFLVSGVLTTAKKLFSSNVQLVVVASSIVQRDLWLNAVRVRICPWQALYYQFKRQLSNRSLSLEAFGLVAQESEGKKLHIHDRQLPSEIVGRFQEVLLLPEAVNNLSAFVGNVATVAKTSSTATSFKENFEAVANVAKCVTIVGSAFQVAILCATLVDMGIEMKRGIDTLPRIKATIEELHTAIVVNMDHILHPDTTVDELLVRNLFEVQGKLFCSLFAVERQLMRTGVRGAIASYLKSGELRKLEQALRELKDNVISVVHSGEIARLNTEMRNLTNALMENRPELTSLFVARGKELDQGTKILEEHKSAVLMQHCAIEITRKELYSTSRAAENGWIPDGSFWISMCGSITEAIELVTNLTGSLARKYVNVKERLELRAVVLELGRKLELFKGRRQLYLNRKGTQDEISVVEKLVILTGRLGGWFFAASRQGARTLSTQVIWKQRIGNSPFRKSDAIIALSQWKEKLLSHLKGDKELLEQPTRMEENGPYEYEAVRELTNNQHHHSMSGLPLALAQAECLAHKHRVPLVSYLDMVSDTRRRYHV